MGFEVGEGLWPSAIALMLIEVVHDMPIVRLARISDGKLRETWQILARFYLQRSICMNSAHPRLRLLAGRRLARIFSVDLPYVIEVHISCAST